jgi:hypothetical protein
MPIELDKTTYTPEDIFKPIAVFKNITKEDLIVPVQPGVLATDSEYKVSILFFDFWIHRKDNKQIFLDPFTKLKTDSTRLSCGNKAEFPLKIETGGNFTIPINQCSVVKLLNLPSGEYELVLYTRPYSDGSSEVSLKKISPGNLIRTEKITFSVENDDYNKISLNEVKKDRENLSKQNDPISKKFVSILKVSELTISNIEVKRGSSFIATCNLDNPSKDDLVYTHSIVHGSSLHFRHLWLINKIPIIQGRQIIASPTTIFYPTQTKLSDIKDRKITIAPQSSYEIKCTVDTDKLEPGLYELSVNIMFGDKMLKTTPIKFKVTN